MKFTKMHGLGNDYIYVYAKEVPANAEELSRKLSERRFGIGSDGMIWILPSDKADFEMRIFNADGSEAKMCGNGIRCVGKYVYDKGLTDKKDITVDTLSGIKTLKLIVKDGKVTDATVGMGKSRVEKPVTLSACGEEVACVPVDMGNPHAVIFTDDAENAPLTTVGASLEHNQFFPDGVNVEFVKILSEHEIRMRVWERGSGITAACGTGACASVSAAVKAGRCLENEDITVFLDGGKLTVRTDHDGSVTMSGPAETVFEGEVSDD